MPHPFGEIDNTFYKIAHMDVLFPLFTITKNLQCCRVVFKFIDEIMNHTVGEPRSDDIGESEYYRIDPLKVTVCGYDSFRC